MKDNKKREIRDNPSYVELSQTINGIKGIFWVASFLEKFRLKNEKLLNTLKKVPELTKNATRMINLPDKFNSHFAKKGWVAYESMNAEIMEKAIELAEKDKINNAETLLVEYFNEENLNWMLIRMRGINAFKPRERIAQKALEDYLEERYHASIPVVLMIIDGLVNDIEQTGFFTSRTDLTAWDSIAGHSSGLQELSKLFCKTRKKTSTEEIYIPYRNGILHGRDLGYANKIVAAKVWGALFAIGDWARIVQAGNKNPQKTKKKQLTWREIFQRLAKNKERKKLILEWKPRKIQADKDFPSYGKTDDYGKNTPERTFVSFMEFWSKENYGKMAELIKNYFKVPIGKAAGELRENFKGKKLERFEILSIIDKAPALSIIKVRFYYTRNEENLIKKEIEIRVVYEDEDNNPKIRGEPDGSWKIMREIFWDII